MSWPYLPAQCPRCAYFQTLDRPVLEDDGYEISAVCAHPRIGMELFPSERWSTSTLPPCPLFVAASAESSRRPEA